MSHWCVILSHTILWHAAVHVLCALFCTDKYKACRWSCAQRSYLTLAVTTYHQCSLRACVIRPSQHSRRTVSILAVSCFFHLDYVLVLWWLCVPWLRPVRVGYMELKNARVWLLLSCSIHTLQCAGTRLRMWLWGLFWIDWIWLWFAQICDSITSWTGTAYNDA